MNPFVEEDYDSFNIYSSYTWLDVNDGEFEQAGRIVHHLRYNARKAIIDLNEFFYSGIKAEELNRSEKDWIQFLVQYSNRTSNFGFMNNWRKMFDISKDVVVKALERIKRSHYEYCPICKQRMEYRGVVTIDSILKNEKLLVLWWFARGGRTNCLTSGVEDLKDVLVAVETNDYTPQTINEFRKGLRKFFSVSVAAFATGLPFIASFISVSLSMLILPSIPYLRRSISSFLFSKLTSQKSIYA